MNRNSLYYLEHLDAFSIMQSHIMDRVMQEYWQGNLDANGSIMSASTCYGILNHDSDKFDYELQNRFYKKRDEKAIAPHKFNFEVVRRSMQIRYIFEMAFFFIVVLVFQYYCLQFTQTWNDLQADMVEKFYQYEFLMNDIRCDKAEDDYLASIDPKLWFTIDKKDLNFPECEWKRDQDDEDRRLLSSALGFGRRFMQGN